MEEEKIIKIDPLSCSSLLINIKGDGEDLGFATGFIVEEKGNTFLITNRHVFLDEKNYTNPKEVLIFHHSKENLGSWILKSEKLYENSSPRWIEHPLKQDVDVVALPLRELELTKTYPLNLSLSDADMVIEPAMPLVIIGFPEGNTSGGISQGLFPIWKVGHVASDPDLDYGSRPIFLIDATTRGGMSGSPVLARLWGGYKTRSNQMIISSTPRTKFLGIYSGRINERIEIGLVWKPHVISEILNNPKRVD